MEQVGMDYVASLISEPLLGKTGTLFLANPEGEVLLREKPAGGPRKDALRVPYFRDLPFAPARTAVYPGSAGKPVLGSWKWIPRFQCFLIAEQDAEEAFAPLQLLTRRALILFGVSTAMVLLVAYGAIGMVTRPVRLLSETVDSFAEGHFQKALVMDRRDEIGRLMEGFTKMAAKLQRAYEALEGKVKASNTELEEAYYLLKQRQEQLIRSEKMAALGQLSAGVAHEIRNPLTSIKLFIQGLEKEMEPDGSRQEDFRIIKKEIDRLNEIVVRFLNFARPEDPQFQPLHLPALTLDTLNLLSVKIRNQGVRLDVSFPPELPRVKGDPRQLDQVILNLLLNAIEAMPAGGALTVRSDVETLPGTQEPRLRLMIRDTGPGIPKQEKSYLFDPFFTTKEGGTGLGLSIAYAIVQKHDGQIEVESEEGKGTAFFLYLPLAEEERWIKSPSSTTT
jgi:signal transduction histidine kinase